MFARPRIRKNPLPPPAKKRKRDHAVEEIAFDKDARTEYLTGFHKRKQQRIKVAQEAAAEKARQEKIEFRKQLREERQQAVEDHVQRVNALLREAQQAGQEDDKSADLGAEDDEWSGIEEEVRIQPVDHEEEYIDEDRYTTVTIEAVNIDREGLHKPEHDSEDDEEDVKESERAQEAARNPSKERTPRAKKKKFRYESKGERRLAERRQKAKKRKIIG